MDKWYQRLQESYKRSLGGILLPCVSAGLLEFQELIFCLWQLNVIECQEADSDLVIQSVRVYLVMFS